MKHHSGKLPHGWILTDVSLDITVTPSMILFPLNFNISELLYCIYIHTHMYTHTHAHFISFQHWEKRLKTLRTVMYLHCRSRFRGLFLHTQSAFSFAARPDNLATADQEKKTHIAKIQQQSRNKDKSFSLQTNNRHLVSIQRLRLSEEFYSRFALHIRRRRCTASISSRIPIQKQSRIRRWAHIGGTRFLLQSRVPRLLHSSMHQWSHWKRVFSCCCTISAFETHSAVPHGTTSCHANDPKAWTGTCMQCIPFY